MRSFIASLRLIRNLTPVHPVSNVCEAVPISLFQASNRLNEITGNAFRISLHPDWQIDRSFFLTSQSWCVIKSWYTGGGPEQGFWRCFADGLDQSLVSSVAQARVSLQPLNFFKIVVNFDLSQRGA